MRTASLCLLASLISSPLLAGYPYQKSAPTYVDAPCERHCHSKCCCKKQGSRDSSNRSMPSGPVAESFPETRAMPALMAIPTLTMFRTVSVESDSRSRSGSQCDDQEERINELDARIEAIHLRMQTVQRSVELQTQILEEIKLKGTIGGTRIPLKPVTQVGSPVGATPEATPASPKDALNVLKAKLHAYKEFAEGDDVQQRIDDVLKALEAYIPLAD